MNLALPAIYVSHNETILGIYYINLINFYSVEKDAHCFIKQQS